MHKRKIYQAWQLQIAKGILRRIELYSMEIYLGYLGEVLPLEACGENTNFPFKFSICQNKIVFLNMLKILFKLKKFIINK